MEHLKWDDEAERRLAAVPFVVRGMARSKIEDAVRAQGRDRVTAQDYEQSYQSFRRAFGAKGEAAVKNAAPARKADNPDMVLVETCSGEVRACPHLLIPVGQWADALENALREIGFGERLLQRLEDDVVLLHHKFRISISGCPNCCSQPQIMDFGVHGQWAPRYEEGCTGCGMCVEACPDECISLTDGPRIEHDLCLCCGDCVKACPVDDCLVSTRRGARIMVGGKLGRHPHLADPAAEFASLQQAKRSLLALAESYLATSYPGERVADWARRTGRTASSLL